MPFAKTYRPAPIFTELGSGFADPVTAAEFPMQRLRFRNQRWATRVGLGELTGDEWARHFALFAPLPENLPQPLALRYHGHQFRSYNPDLGDGRGFLFAQLKDVVSGRVLDLGTKGSGQTPYSRSGDGRLTLKGAVREILATEMLESLGVETSKTFSVFETGEALSRGDEPSPTRSAVLVRLGHSHIRFGTFQRLAVLNEPEKMKELVSYCLRHYLSVGFSPGFSPGFSTEPGGSEVAMLFREVVLRSARLAASWMIAGFVHGVLNTDNMNICGESFDYGPYRFLPYYDPAFTAAYFDHSGLYAFGRQPETVFWNLQQLASALSLISDVAPLSEALQEYGDVFNLAVTEFLLARLGVVSRGHDSDDDLLLKTMGFLMTSKAGFARFFFDWFGADSSRAEQNPLAKSIYSGENFALFFSSIQGYKPDVRALACRQDGHQRPEPCDLLIDEIEAIWAAISQSDDWSLLEAKVNTLRKTGEFYGHSPI